MDPMIRIANLAEDVSKCAQVMLELRGAYQLEELQAAIGRQQRTGYQLAMLEAEGIVCSVAGFRIGENLAWGRFLYVDDLVTKATQRSRGYGALMLSWLKEHARAEGCAELHLDSGLQRHSAHRFYEREQLSRASVHFRITL